MVARVRVKDREKDWDEVGFQRFCRKLELSLMVRNAAKAHDQLSAFARSLEEERRPQLEIGDSVALLLDAETAGILQAEGYDTISSVLYATDDELAKIHMFGPKRLKKVRDALAEQNFALPKKVQFSRQTR